MGLEIKIPTREELIADLGAILQFRNTPLGAEWITELYLIPERLLHSYAVWRIVKGDITDITYFHEYQEAKSSMEFRQGRTCPTREAKLIKLS